MTSKTRRLTITRHSLRFALLLLTAILWMACARQEAAYKYAQAVFPPGTPHEFAANATICQTDADCIEGLPCQRGLCANLYYRDEMDQGDDPFNPGCHFDYADAACTRNKTFFDGDRCRDHIILLEWVDRTCHDDMDLFATDCDDLCKLLQPPFDHGVCITILNHCGPGNHSAKCNCYNDPVPPVEEID